MPTCNPAYITDVVELVQKQRPQSVLDIGIGFGKWGHLFREYLDVWYGRMFKEDWKVRIDGVEIFEPYITDHQRYIYNNIHVGSILDVIDTLPNYDLIYMADVLEHIEKEAAVELIKKLRKKSKAFVLAIPMTEVWLKQGAHHGNEAERHISAWHPEDFVPFEVEQKYFEYTRKMDYPINVYLMR